MRLAPLSCTVVTTLVASLALAGLLVAAACDRLVLARPPAVRRDQAGIDQGAALDHQPPLVELAVELGHQLLGQAAPAQLAAKARRGRVIRHRVSQRQADEAPTGQAVRKRVLEPGVGQPVPLLRQEALEHDHRPAT